MVSKRYSPFVPTGYSPFVCIIDCNWPMAVKVGAQFQQYDTATACTQLADQAPYEHVGTFNSTYSISLQSRAEHLSPHGRPSETMAGLGRMLASTHAARVCSDGSCPGIFPDNYHLEHLDHYPQRGPTLHGVSRCVAATRAQTLRPSHPACPSATC